MSATVVSPYNVWRREHRGERDRSYSTLVCSRGERISRALALQLGLLDDPPAPRSDAVSFLVLPAPSGDAGDKWATRRRSNSRNDDKRRQP